MSHITDDELESLGPSDQSSFNAPSSDDHERSGSDSSISVGKVSFSPVHLVINCPGEGEKDSAVRKLGEGAGRPRLGVRTVEAPSPAKAWSRVVAGFSASLQPLLSPNTMQGHGVASFSPRVPSSEDSSSPSSSLGLSIDDEEAAEYGFCPIQSAGRFVLKLPMLSTKGRGRSASLDPPCHSILKSPDRPSSTTTTSPRVNTIPLSTSASPPTSSTFSCLSLSPSVLASPAHLAQIETAPLRACCTACVLAAEEGAKAGYEEGWSKSARRKRRNDMKAMKKAIELLDAGDISAAQLLVGLPEDEDGEVPISERQMTKAQVDEVGDCGRGEEDESHEEEEDGTSSSDEDSSSAPPPVAEQKIQSPPSDQTTTTPVDIPTFISNKEDSSSPSSPDPIISSSVSPPNKPEVYNAPAPAPLKPVPPKPKRKFSLSTIGSRIADSARGAAAAQTRMPM